MYNVALVMKDRTAAAEIRNLQAYMEADTVVNKLMEAAETVEDMYEVAKRYIQIKFEDFRQAFNEAMDYLKGSKVELDDDIMECVAGGFSWGGLWNTLKKVAVAVAVGAVVVGACVVTGGVAGAVLGATVGAIAGTGVAAGATTGIIGGMITGGVLSAYNIYKGAKDA